ncbi:MAG: DnaJ domain-containing protein [Euryarchaeota archaeon]|nr:DnaJ domain-containing protein [Euryarchaeota archaeon]MDE1836644.1 DnaJ domain-containing protein [Euryarchaeota archaeon]MDE1879161.1 DnaJ domain-containing protein [Euryarchaeota archaeon]MDE2044614.1 DnaJ domain-containing protein [Thermoplasmata archaeon]
MVTLEEAYRLLGLKPSATEKEVRKAYRTKVRAVHPDLAGDTEDNHGKMVALNEAVERIESASAAERMLLVNGWGTAERRTPEPAATMQDFMDDLLGSQNGQWYARFIEQMSQERRQAEAARAATARVTVGSSPVQPAPEPEVPKDIGPDQEWAAHMACPTCGRGVMAYGRGPLLFKTTELNGIEHQCPTGTAAPYIPRHQRRRARR